MGKTVQHLFAFADTVNGGPVIFLVEKETGLLPVFDIYNIFYTVFYNFHAGVKRFCKKPFITFHALLEPDFGITSFIDTAYDNTVIF